MWARSLPRPVLVVAALVALTASCSARSRPAGPAGSGHDTAVSPPASDRALVARPAAVTSACVLPGAPGPAPRAGLLLHLSVTDRRQWERAEGTFTVTNTTGTTATFEQQLNGADFQQIQDASGKTVNGGQLPEYPIHYARVVVPPHRSVRIRADFPKYPCERGTGQPKARGPFLAVGHLTVRTSGGTVRSWFASNTARVTDALVD